MATPIRLGASDTAWIDFDTQASGPLSTATRDRIAARTVLNGMAQPAASRTSLADSLVGDRQPIADHLTDARAHAASSSIRAETAFALHHLRAFHTDGKRLTDPTATRFLVALESIPVRDRLWDDMNTHTATSHVALWSDLTRRAPDSLRAAPATMLAFASWLKGNGALAWCALDQVPRDKPYDAAHLVTAVVQNGVHPREWAALTTAAPDVSQRIEALSATSEDTTRPAPTRNLSTDMNTTHHRHTSPSRIERLLARLAGHRSISRPVICAGRPHPRHPRRADPRRSLNRGTHPAVGGRAHLLYGRTYPRSPR